jgi:hypothetical protein
VFFDISKTIRYWVDSAEDFARQKFAEIEDVYKWLIQKLEI